MEMTVIMYKQIMHEAGDLHEGGQCFLKWGQENFLEKVLLELNVGR